MRPLQIAKEIRKPSDWKYRNAQDLGDIPELFTLEEMDKFFEQGIIFFGEWETSTRCSLPWFLTELGMRYSAKNGLKKFPSLHELIAEGFKEAINNFMTVQMSYESYCDNYGLDPHGPDESYNILCFAEGYLNRNPECIWIIDHYIQQQMK